MHPQRIESNSAMNSYSIHGHAVQRRWSSSFRQLPFFRRTRQPSLAGTEQERNALDAALLQATIEGDLSRVKALTHQGANRHVAHSSAMLPDVYDREAFDTPLEAASWLGHTDIVRFFLSSSSSPPRKKLSSRRLLLRKRKSPKSVLPFDNYPQPQDSEREDNPHPAAIPSASSVLADRLDREAFLVACHGGTLATVQCFVETLGREIVVTPPPPIDGDASPTSVTPLHHACARCDLALLQYLLSHGARLTDHVRGSAPPIFWLGMYVEMYDLHQQQLQQQQQEDQSEHSDDDHEMAPPIPLPPNLSMGAYEACLAWIIRHHKASLFVTDSRGVTALQRLLHRAPMGLLKTAIVGLVSSCAVEC